MNFCGVCGYDIAACDCLNDDGDEDDEPEFCSHCDGSGRIPAPDYLAIQGKSYVACVHCENGLRWPEYC